MNDDLDIKPEMFWIDLETTGLDAETDRPLEIGVILTDRYLRFVDTFRALVWEDNKGYLDAKQNCIPIVREMHDKNGLWEDLAHEYVDRFTADMALTTWLHRAGVESGVLPMAGSSIGSLDRPFVQRHFPMLNKYLHYRNIDISSIKELCRIWRPDLVAAWDETSGGKEAAAHRVLEDAENSINEYKFYIQSGFIEIPTPEYLKIR